MSPHEAMIKEWIIESKFKNLQMYMLLIKMKFSKTKNRWIFLYIQEGS